MIDQQHAKTLGDVGATGLTGIVIVSQYAQLLVPIATLVLTFLGIVWWCIRFGEWLTEEPEVAAPPRPDKDEDGVRP